MPDDIDSTVSDTEDTYTADALDYLDLAARKYEEAPRFLQLCALEDAAALFASAVRRIVPSDDLYEIDVDDRKYLALNVYNGDGRPQRCIARDADLRLPRCWRSDNHYDDWVLERVEPGDDRQAYTSGDGYGHYHFAPADVLIEFANDARAIIRECRRIRKLAKAVA